MKRFLVFCVAVSLASGAVCAQQAERVSSFDRTSGMALAVNGTDSCYVNRNGSAIALPMGIYEFHPFNDGYARVRYVPTGKWGLIDSKGRIVAAPVYDEMTDFVRWHAVATKSGKSYRINRTGDRRRLSFKADSTLVLLDNGTGRLTTSDGKTVIHLNRFLSMTSASAETGDGLIQGNDKKEDTPDIGQYEIQTERLTVGRSKPYRKTTFRFGVTAGLGVNHVNVPLAIQSVDHMGWNMGVYAEWDFTDHLGIRAEAGYTDKRAGFILYDATIMTGQKYLSIPVSLMYRMKSFIAIEAGICQNVAIHSYLKSGSPVYVASPDTGVYKASLAASAGVHFNVCSRLSLFARFYHSLGPAYRIYEDLCPTWMLTTGIGFDIFKTVNRAF